MKYIEVKGIISFLCVATNPDDLQSRETNILPAEFDGISADKHSGITRRSDSRVKFCKKGTEIWNSRQISVVSHEELHQISCEMGLPQIMPQWLGANICISGIPNLSSLPPSTRLISSHKTAPFLYVTEENLPCIHPGKLIQIYYPGIPNLEQLFPKVAMHKRGVVAVVEKPGIFIKGEEIIARIPIFKPYTTEILA